MELGSAWCGLHAPNIRLSSNQRLSSHKSVSPSCETSRSHSGFNYGKFWGRNESKSYMIAGLKRTSKVSSMRSFKKGLTVYASKSNPDGELDLSGRETTPLPGNGADGVEPFRGKSGSISFSGLNHQLVEESKSMSAPFKQSTGSLLWILAPAALISSLVLPPIVVTAAVDVFFEDEILREILASFASEVIFYIGLATFLLVSDKVQKPYLQFSSKRWSLVTGLRGYLTSSFLTMGLKVFFPIFAVFATWPVLGLPAVVAVAPFLAGCLAQLVFENVLASRGSSCWPLVPIIFEVYRLYQLTKAAHFLEILMFAMKEVPASPEVLQRSSAMVAMFVTFQALGIICLWSLLTFLLRLFPSRPVAENY